MNFKSDSDQLDQRMLELVYELVDDDEAARLRERIAGEPAAADAYERAQRTARLFSAAAKWHEAPIRMRNAEFGVRNGQVRIAANGVRSAVEVRSEASASDARAVEDVSAGLRRALQWAVG